MSRLRNRYTVHVARAGRAVLRDLTSPPWKPAGHYYSPVATADDRRRAATERRPPTGAVDLREAEQVELARQLDLSPPVSGRWAEGNDMFGSVDAAILRGMLLHHRPKRVVEIGSGHSTGLMLDVADQHLPHLQVTCVEPYPDRLLSRLRPEDHDRLTLIRQPAQDVPISDFVGQLEAGDVFFIDSTHVVKAASDVVWLFLHVLPALPDGVLVHIHDMYWPFEYPDAWLHEGRDWTEAYLVHAFLAYNSRFRITLFGDWLAHQHPELLAGARPGEEVGSLWLEKVAPS